MSDTAFILIVEDEQAHGEAIAEALRRPNFACHVVHSAEDAVQSIQHRTPDVVITDYKLGGDMTGVDVLREAKQHSPETEVILITAYGSEQLARDVLSDDGAYRAYDYLIKPLNTDELRDKVQRAARKALQSREQSLMKKQLAESFEFSGIIGTSESMRRLAKRVQKLANSKSTVLITGETGVGKELIAQAIHLNSSRAGKSFRVLNCAAVSETLIESELFGHVRGAFTGADRDRPGVIEAADEGTLFLDEIGDMPLPMQAKLLRSIETGEVIRVGSNEAVHFDVRFVAATNRDLQEMVSEGSFREDLFYRLHAQSPLRIPPLRERKEDIPILVQKFIETANREHDSNVMGTRSDVMRQLVNYTWKGNVRELKDTIERMCIEAEGEYLEMADLPERLRGTREIVRTGPTDLAGMKMADVERWHIVNTLRMFGGNREQTAKALGIGARTLYRKLREYGINQ